MATKTLTDDEKNQGVNNATGTTLDGAGTGGGSQTGTNWTNLSQYLDNNKGSGAGMADDITKDSQNEVNRIYGQGGVIDNWQTGAKAQVDANTRQDKYSNTIKTGTDKDVAGIDQDAYKQWGKLGNYWGDVKDSTQSNGYNQAYSDVNNAKDGIKNLGSYDGQKAALQKSYGQTGTYGTGFQNLDAFALNGDASGQQKLQNFQAQNANFGQKFDTAKTGVKSYIDGAEATGKGVLDDTNKAITARQGTIYDTGARARDVDADSIYKNDLDAANAKAPTDNSLTGHSGTQYVTQNRGDAQAYLSQDGLGALNKLNALDDSDATGQMEAGQTAKHGINWQALGVYAPNIGPGSLAPGSLVPESKPATQFADGSSVDAAGYTPHEHPRVRERTKSIIR